MLKTIRDACDVGSGTVYLFQGGCSSPHVWTADKNLYSQEERNAISDLIRWGYCRWTGFLAGDLGCAITDEGRTQLAEDD